MTPWNNSSLASLIEQSINEFRTTPFARAPERIVPNVSNQTGADGVRYEVAHRHRAILFSPEDMIVGPALPQPLASRAAMCISCFLFPPVDQPLEVTRRCGPFEQQMYVVRHETVRRNCKALLAGGAQQVRTHHVHRAGVSKPGPSPKSAACNGVFSRAAI